MITSTLSQLQTPRAEDSFVNNPVAMSSNRTVILLEGLDCFSEETLAEKLS